MVRNFIRKVLEELEADTAKFARYKFGSAMIEYRVGDYSYGEIRICHNQFLTKLDVHKPISKARLRRYIDTMIMINRKNK